MILYDQNYNFLGISNETVSFLGYEDLEEFTSLHSDFANLLVPKDGSIYKFKNFSWIDFILYSGAPNKAAIVKLKNGEEVDIKLTVKEIFFAKEFNGLQKCYAVRIISDKFVHIASKVDATLKSEAKSGVNLGNLISDSQLDTPQLKEDKIEDLPKQEEEIVLNFNSQSYTEEPKEELRDDSKELQEQEGESEKVIIDLTSENDDTKESKSNFNLNFLGNLGSSKKAESKEENKNTEDTNDEKKSDSLINLNFLKNTTKENKEEEEVTSIAKPVQTPSLNFLKNSSNDSKEVMIENATHTKLIDDNNSDTSEFKLKFKSDDKQEEESIKNDDDIKQQFVSSNKEEIIEQIKNDITEIDQEVKVQENTQPFKETLSTITINREKEGQNNDDKNNTSEFVSPKTQSSNYTPIDSIEDEDLVYDFIYDAKSNITLLKSFLFDENYKKALYPIAKMQTSADILNLNDIISSLNSIKSSTQSKDKESILNHINILEKKLNILKSKIKGEAAFS